ncbi:MAG: methyltransferase domain-containing protein [Acidimicrobiales bacterium]
MAVRYVDRWLPAENRALFRELGEDAAFPQPDIVSNLDADRLGAIDDQSQDFVIASHVLEHVANPVALLGDVHRVLRPGGTLLVLLPDRHRTFDRDRRPTPLAHLVEEYERGVEEVDDDHVADFLVGTGVPIPDDPGERSAVFDLHRRRSIHVHCWDEHEFFEVLVHSVAVLGHRWELVDAVLSDDEGKDGFEFGYVLRRAPALHDPDVLAERLRLSWRRWYDHRRWWHSHLAALRSLRTAAGDAAGDGSAAAATTEPVTNGGPWREHGESPISESVRRFLASLASRAADLGSPRLSRLRASGRRPPGRTGD